MFNISNVAGKLHQNHWNAFSPMPLGSSVWRLSIRYASQALHLRSHEVSVWVSVSIEFHVVCSFLKLYLLMRETHHYANHIHPIPSYTISAQIYVKSSWVLVSYIRSVPTELNTPVASDPTSGEYQLVGK